MNQMTDLDKSYAIPGDWYPNTLPSNILFDEYTFLETSYSFTSFNSEKSKGISFGYASGNYGNSNFMVGKYGSLIVGEYVILNSTNIICNSSIIIGDHCMFGWGSIV